MAEESKGTADQNTEALSGNQLFDEVMSLTGLPKELVSEDLAPVLQRLGVTPESMTLDDLRRAMAEYLAEVFARHGK